MDNDVNFMTEMEELVNKAESRYQTAKAALKSDRERLKKMYDFFCLSSESLTRVMLKDLDKMKNALRLAAKNNDPPTAYNLLDRLQACLNDASSTSNRMEAAKEELFNGAHDILKCYMTTKREEILQVRKVLANQTVLPVEGIIQKSDTSLVTITTVSDPGKFYVVHNNDIKMHDRLSAELQVVAPNCPVADIILPDQVYAILNNGKEWARATAQLHFDVFQVEEEPSDIFYDCFLLDFGHYERIPKSNVRVLPTDLMGLPPFVKECTLNEKFIHRNWSPKSIALFKDWTLSSPIEMKVLAQKERVFHVDLYRFEENYGMVSAMNSLMIARQLPFVPRTVASIKKFKPKYCSEDLKSNPVKHASVIITRATQPGEIYVQIDDQELPLYHKMQKDLQNEFHSASKSSPSYCSAPVPGDAYVIKFNDKFHRVIIEKYENMKTKVFFVDMGNRLVLNQNLEIHNIPNRFMELPAQAIRCHLHAVRPGKKLSDENWRSDLKRMFQFMGRYDGKRAVALVETWSGNDVGFVLYPRSMIPLTTELKAFVILYDNEDTVSINQQICQNMGYVSDMNFKISENSLPQRPTIQHESRMSSSMTTDSSSPQSTTSSKPSFCSLFKPIWKSFDLPEIGDSFTARVTWFNEIGDIFLQDVGSKMQLDFIRQHLYEKYDGTRPTGTDMCCSLGDRCIFKFKKEWYRGTVRAVREKEVEIFFTDFGIVGVVDISSIRLDIALEEIPAQVLRCSLFNLKPVFGKQGWNVTEQEGIFKKISECDYRVIVKDPGPPTQVELVYLSPVYRSLNRELVAQQLADFIK